MRRVRGRLITVLFAAVAAVSGAAAEGERDDGSAVRQQDVAERAAVIAGRGLAYLAAQQNEDRSFSVAAGEDAKRAPLAVTALAALAFMSGGSTTGRGPHRQQVQSAIQYLLDHQVEAPPPGVGPSRDGVVQYGYFTVESDHTSKMHGHGFATLAVAEAYGTLNVDRSYGESAGPKAREDLRRMRDALAAAVRLIEESQAEVGGWYYRPYEKDHEGSMTVLMIQALRAARNVGIDVDRGVIERAVRYMHNSQRPDGAFRYQLGHTTATYALTAAAVATLNASGDYDSQVIDLGIEFMRRQDPILNADQWAVDHNFPFYGRLYAAQAYYLYRDPRLWEEWYPRVVDVLESLQTDSAGYFEGGEYGRVYATAMSCLVLQIPCQYLPIFQK